MSILWCGGEDIDFPNGSALTWISGVSYLRTGYARCNYYISGTAVYAQSKPFVGGAITSGWLHCYARPYSTNNYGDIGLTLSGSPKGIYLGQGNNAANLAILKYDGTTWTVIAEGSGHGYVASLFDMQIINYGENATVKAYINGVLNITYTGDIRISGVDNLDSVSLFSASSANFWNFSEIIVADQDTRTLSLLTMIPTGAGVVDQWTGVYGSVDEGVINDTDVNYTNTADQRQQYALTNTPTGDFSVRAIKIAARAAKSSDASIGSLRIGISGEVTISGEYALDTTFATYERLLNVNPVTTNHFTEAEIDALQINIESKA